MAEAVDGLFVKLGLQTDQKSFDEGMQAFGAVRSAALQMGAAIGAGVGLEQLTVGFAKSRDEMVKFANTMGTTPQFVSDLGFALERAGGTAEDAFGSIRNIRDLMFDAQMGRINEDAFLFGFDPTRLAEAESVADAYRIVAEEMQGLTGEQQRVTAEALGIDMAQLRVFQDGPSGMQALFDEAQSLQEITAESGQAAQEFNDAVARMTRAMDGLTQQISTDATNNLAIFMNLVTEFIRENKDLLGDLIETGTTGGAPGWLIRNWDKTPGGFILNKLGVGADDSEDGQVTSANMRNNLGFRNLVSAAEREIGAPPGMLWAQIGKESDFDPNAVSDAGARGLAQIMPKTEQSLESRFGEQMNPFDPADALRMQQELMRENFERTGNWDEALREYHGGLDRSQWGPVNEAYAPSIRERMGQATGSVNNINVDARGSSNPAETRAAARRGVNEALASLTERSVQDLSVGLS